MKGCILENAEFGMGEAMVLGDLRGLRRGGKFGIEICNQELLSPLDFLIGKPA
jgi:hypothetical protein